MSEQQLRDLLVRSAEGVAVSAPPVAEISSDARRRRTRRSWALTAVVLPVAGVVVLAAMLGGGRDPVEPAGPTIDLPTSDWRRGDASYTALFSGVLSLDERGCVVLGHGVVPVWPRGWSADRVGDGLVLRDEDGDVVAQDGDRVEMGGGYGPPTEDHACTRGNSEVAFVQSEVTVVPIGLPTSDWDGSGPSMEALITGRVQTDRDGCVRVGPYVAAWPTGYTAEMTDHGVEVSGPGGRLVAREGDQIESSGGYLEGSSEHPCTEGEPEVAYLQDEVRVVAP